MRGGKQPRVPLPPNTTTIREILFKRQEAIRLTDYNTDLKPHISSDMESLKYNLSIVQKALSAFHDAISKWVMALRNQDLDAEGTRECKTAIRGYRGNIKCLETCEYWVEDCIKTIELKAIRR
uniref:hypothetical protein n=1 Tax=Cutaneotrichosporon cutaneum TaxID=5554 RepID=UPI00226CAEA2|nr:hypothetical protein OYW64_mgp22 [Cutaneotrichosporon cutaneum]UZC57743.1 hypothetical protein [Cutaneotrichosporon cutaneum]